MNERPILFSAPMVRALLDGRKTQTRRVIKPQPHPSQHEAGLWLRSCGRSTYDTNGRREEVINKATGAKTVRDYYLPVEEWLREQCRYGKPGDRLWVKEKHYFTFVKGHERDGEIIYAADLPDGTRPSKYGNPWRSPIRIPRWASRITLEITNVRVERVQQVGEFDCRSEGFRRVPDGPNIVAAFRRLWDELNGKTYPWSSNPWVWVVSFKRINR